MRKRDAAAALGGIWGMVFLLYTPRGERIMRRVDRALFPDWLTK